MKFLDSMKERNNIHFNKEQKKALKHTNGPALILAGPGSGKTTVIIARTGYLIFQLGVSKWKILTLTFNKAAQLEMSKRFNNLFPEAKGVCFSTLHSFCNQVVKDYQVRQGRKLTIIEGEKGGKPVKKNILKNIYQQINGNINEEELESVINEIGLVKNMLIKEYDDLSLTTRNFEEIFKKYEEYKKQNYYMDFDDMLTYAYAILKKCPDILNKYKGKYEYIQIDEGQDLSKIQFEIIELLVNKQRPNLYVVADDDQSIYGFRGAQPEYILKMESMLNNVTVYKMENNYRSSENIVKISSHFIKNNKHRYDKNHKTQNRLKNDPYIIKVKNEKEQLEFLKSKTKEILNKNQDKSIGILYRSNISSILIINALEQENINFNIKQNKLVFYKHWMVRDIIAFLIFSYNGTDIDAFMRIYYKMNKYISKEIVLNYLNDSNGQSVLDYMINSNKIESYQKRNITKLKKDFKGLSKKRPALALECIQNNLNYLDWLKEYCKKTGISFDYLNRLFEILKTVAADYSTIPSFINRLSQLDHIILKGNSIKKEVEANISLTTMHSSKGLEYDTVFIIDLYNREIPGQGIQEEERFVEEERRLFYVALTRAKDNLYLISPERISGKTEKRSIFIDEVIISINKNIKDRIKQGVMIKHNKYGEGIISKVINKKNKTIIEVSFGNSKYNLDLLMCIQKNIIKIL